jgi:hypothetical protein
VARLRVPVVLLHGFVQQLDELRHAVACEANASDRVDRSTFVV